MTRVAYSCRDCDDYIVEELPGAEHPEMCPFCRVGHDPEDFL
ncbi:hypothetical protein [Halorarius halobius]|nr:hypothetical protein [Halorarius halobius]